MSETYTPADLFALLENDCVRLILEQTSEERMSAKDLDEVAEVSHATVYRHVGKLTERGLLVEETSIEAESRHYSVYWTPLEQLLVALSEGEFGVEVETSHPETTSDTFDRMWDGVQWHSTDSDHT